MARGVKVTQKQVLAAIHESGGIVSVISRRLGVDWHTGKKTIERYPAAVQAVQDERESLVDFAEGQLIKAIKAGEAWAVKFYLATVGKGRGYSERQEVTGPGGGDITIKVVYDDDVDIKLPE